MYNTTNTYHMNSEKNIIGGLIFTCFGICCIMICCSDKICGKNDNRST